ncbi:hypothetical protein D3C75_715880 [compost metagenome]
MTPADDIGHVLQWPQPPADRSPHQQCQRQAAKQEREQRVANDAVDQVVAHIITLTHPDKPVFFRHRQNETAPLFTATGKVVEPWSSGWWVDGWRTGCMHQQRHAFSPDLERQLAFVRVAHLMPPCFAQGIVEGLIQRLTRALLYRHAHDALQQTRVLGQVRVIHLVNFVAAVVVVIEREQAGTE